MKSKTKPTTQIRRIIPFLLIMIIPILLVQMSNAAPKRTATYTQEHFWFLDDDGNINNGTGYGNPDTIQNANIADITSNTKFRLRLSINQSINNPTENLTLQPQLQYAVDSPNCIGGSWTNVPIATNCGSNPICQTPSANFTDGDLTTQRFTDGHTFVSGGDGVNASGSTNTVTYTDNNEHAEWEWALTTTPNILGNTNYNLRIAYSDGSNIDNYVLCPNLTTQANYSLDQISYRWRNDDGRENAGSNLVGFLRPDADFSIAWDVVNPAGPHFSAIDEGATPNTSDYIEATNQTTDEFDLGTISGGGTYNRIDIHLYALTPDNDEIGVNLVVNGTDQTEQFFAPGNSYSWQTISFTGLSLSQTDLDNLRVKLRHSKVARIDSVRVATMRVEVFESLPPASYKANENTPVTGQRKNENVRVRFLVNNSGPDSAGINDFRLQIAPMTGANCLGGDETFTDVAVQASCGSSAACMSTSTYITNQESTSNSAGLSDPGGTFVSGKLVEDPDNQATNLTLNANEFTELEYNFQFTSNATDGATYCLRTVKATGPLNVYTNNAHITLSSTGGYALSGTYISNPFDTGTPSAFNAIEWNWSLTNPACATCNIRLQIQTAPDVSGSPGTWSTTWSGPEGDDGDETDYFTVSTGELIHTDHNGDQWIRYRATLDGDGNETPILEEVKINYQ